MRKLSFEAREYQLRRKKKLALRDFTSKAKRLKKRRGELGERGSKQAFTTTIQRGKIISLELPRVLSLSDNSEETLDFFETLRTYATHRRRGRLKINFLTLEKVTPGAALVLAAELDRWRYIVNNRLRVFDINEWNPNVKALLHDMGLFSLLDVVNPPHVIYVETDLIFIRFQSGLSVLGELAKKLRISIEEVAGKIPDASSLYDGLTEAMTNVMHHAYPKGADYNTIPINGQWWMAGSFNKVDRLLTIMFYDQGKGIPYTLPRTRPLEVINGYLQKVGIPDDDSARIRAAMNMGRSQTRQPHRGKGLLDIRGFVDESENGRLRILSGKGEYIYRSDGSEEQRTLNQSIGGTLIQWEVSLPSNPVIGS